MKILNNSQNFQWVGEGVPLQKRGKKIRYEAFILGDLKIEIGDFVLVRNDDALDPEDFMSCYVAQVKNLFDTGDEFDPYQAQVQWFSRVLELPTYAIKLFENVGHELEVVKDKRSSYHNMIDAETIFQKCEVLFLPSNCDFELALSKHRKYTQFKTPIFFCRYIFTGTSLIEAKDQFKPANISLSNGNSTLNSSTSHVRTTEASSMTPVKSKSVKKTSENYCAFSVGSPSKIPRVVIKKMDDKILESENKNIRIFVADSKVTNIEDVAEIFLNKLKLEKQEEKTLEKKPVQNITKKTVRNGVDNDFIYCDSDVKTETFNSPQKEDNIKINFNAKFCKNIVTRNSPKKNASENICTSPTKKPKIIMLSDLKLKPSNLTNNIVDEGALKTRSRKSKQEKLKNQYNIVNPEKKILKNVEICEKNYHSLSDAETDDLLPTNLINNIVNEDTLKIRPGKNKHRSHKNQYSNEVPEKKVLKNDVCEKNGHSISDVEIDDLSLSLKIRKCSINKETSSPAQKSLKQTEANFKITFNKFAELENTKFSSTSNKKGACDVSKLSPNKCTKMENSDSFSTPKKKIKFADLNENFRLTRSGRRVKAVNYTENNETSFISTLTPTKLLPHFICSNYSDGESDSDKFSASSHSSDDDDSLSDISLPEETSLHKRKHSLKKKIPGKKSRGSVICTPKSRKSVVSLSIPERKTPLRTPKNALEESRQRLHVSSVPSSLPCRDEEYSDIYSFVKGCLCAQTGGCMYISGVPGTGKTATVHEVMRNLEEEKALGEVPIFTFVEVNGMWMTDPYQCYVQIFKALTGKSIAPQQAADLLEKRFTERGPKKDAVVLLVDELDRLWTRKQTVMYNIFDWPSKKNSKLIVLAIANTMDLPERMMMNRISSRLGLTRKTFQPYTFKQLQEIIMSRIQELKVFHPDAVQLVARKVAAVSGDARRALDICRFATETVKVGHSPKKGQKLLVGMEHVDKALQQMFSSPVISAIRSSSKIVKLFFQCMLSEFTRSGLEETTLLKVYRQVISTCRFEGLNPPNSTEISRICADLAASHLILVDNFKNDLYMKIRLNISSDDVTYALTLK